MLSSLLDSLCVHVHPQDLLYVWTEPKLCMGGMALPEKKTLPCAGMEFWVRLGGAIGAFTAVLLVSLTCYFWKKNKRSNSPFFFLHTCFLSPSPYFFICFIFLFILTHLLFPLLFLLKLIDLFYSILLLSYVFLLSFLPTPCHLLFSAFMPSLLMSYLFLISSLLFRLLACFIFNLLYFLLSSELLFFDTFPSCHSLPVTYQLSSVFIRTQSFFPSTVFILSVVALLGWRTSTPGW